MRILSQIILRTPAFAFSEKALNELNEIDLEDNSYFKKALFFASIQVYDRREAKQFKSVVAKYFSRAMSRATPFGMFTHVGVVKFGDIDNIIKKKENYFNYLTIAPQILFNQYKTIEGQSYNLSLNGSILLYKKSFRYIKAETINDKITYLEIEVERNKYFDFLFEIFKTPTSTLAYETLCNKFKGLVAEVTAKQFIDELIDCKILVGEQLSMGKTLLEYNKVCLERYGLAPCSLEFAKENIDQLNTIRNKENRGDDTFFEIDNFAKFPNGTISSSHKNQIFEYLSFLEYFQPHFKNAAMAEFKRKFYDKYESNEVSLLEVFAGGVLSYGKNLKDYFGDEIIESLYKNSIGNGNEDNLKQHNFYPIDIYLIAKINAALIAGSNEISLDPAELRQFKKQAIQFNTLAVKFSLLKNNTIYFEGAVSNAFAYVGRFSLKNEEIKEIGSDLAKYEKELNPDVLFAELNHFPQISDISHIAHSSFYEYEIPILAEPRKTDEKTVSLNDLYLRLDNEELILWSKSKNKRVIPKFCSAFNYMEKSELSIFNFLCDLQYLDQPKSYHFSLRYFELFAYIPRIKLGEILVFPKTWRIAQSQLDTISTILSADVWYVLVEGDNQLLFSLSNNVLFNEALQLMKQKKVSIVKEYLAGHQSEIVKDEQNGFFQNEFISFVLADKLKIKPYQFTSAEHDVLTKFLPGSDWIYLKIYLLETKADEVIGLLFTKISQAKINYKIRKWFFIRYYDQGFHLRIRFQVVDKKYYTTMLKTLNNVISKLVNNENINTVSYDTYERETTRYGLGNIKGAESVFHIDSLCFCETLALGIFENFEIRRLWIMKSIDQFLDIFNYSVIEKKELFKKLSVQYFLEFNLNAETKKVLSSHYRLNRKSIEDFLPHTTDAIQGILDKRKARICALNDNIGIENNIEAYLHMLLNRAMVTEHRLSEMCIYDFLFHYYDSLSKRV